ncbi:MAG: T9SS type A sorting domain-containing protein [bacterium]
MFSVYKTIISAIIICVFSFSNMFSQEVSTFLTGNGLDGPDGFALDSENNLYVANWGGGSGSTVLKITTSGETSVFVSGLNAPDGLAFDQHGNLYISNYNSGIINKVTHAGDVSEFASGLNHPSALAFDKECNLYVSNHGNANGTTVSKITPDGTVSEFATGLNAPVGLTFDTSGNLYVSNYKSGIINKISSEGTLSVFATISNTPKCYIQYLVFDKHGNLYVPSYGHNKIYKINPAGEVSVFAGTGTSGGADGPVSSSTFNGPNSIALTQEGDMFVSEYNANRIRKISGINVTSIKNETGYVPGKFQLMQNYPNPFNPSTVISFKLSVVGETKLEVYNILGNKVVSLMNETKEPGYYSIEWDGRDSSGSISSSGVYFYQLACDDKVSVKKAILMR